MSLRTILGIAVRVTNLMIESIVTVEGIKRNRTHLTYKTESGTISVYIKGYHGCLACIKADMISDFANFMEPYRGNSMRKDP